MAPLASSANLPSGTEENATVVDAGVNQASPSLRLVTDLSSSKNATVVDVVAIQASPPLHLSMKLNSPLTGREVMRALNGWWIELCRCVRPPSETSVPGITSIKVSAKVTSGEETVLDVQEVSLEEFYKALAQYPQLENMALKELLNQTEQPKLYSQHIKAAQLKEQAEENKEEYEFPYNFLAVAAPIAGWGLTNLMSESTTKIFQDFPHKWTQAVAVLAEDLGIFAIAGAWVMHKKSPFFSKCLMGTGLTFMFAGALFCQAPLLAAARAASVEPF